MSRSLALSYYIILYHIMLYYVMLCIITLCLGSGGRDFGAAVEKEVF